MKHAYLCIGLLAIVGAACSRLAPDSSVKRDVAAISEVRSQLDAAIIARDADRVSNLFTKDSVYLPPDEREVVGRSALNAFLSEAYSRPGPASKSRRVVSEVKVTGDWAFEWGQVESIRPKTGGPDTWIDGKYLHVYQRAEDGKWQIARASYNANPPVSARLAAK